MDRAVANLIQWTDATEAEALACATTTPARLIGITERA